MTVRWAILTGEYPPQTGGVADYTYQVAHGLSAAGDQVVVFAPRHERRDEDEKTRVKVVRLPDRFGPRGLLTLEAALLRRPRPDRILIQYVPHAFGWRAMNLPFVAWVAARAERFAPVWVMFHEVAFPFRLRPLSHAVLAIMHRLMARLLAGAAQRLFITTPAWASVLSRVSPRRKAVAEWLPIPANILTQGAASTGSEGYGDRAPVIGHFGTYGILVAKLLEPILRSVLKTDPQRIGVLLGRGGTEFRDRFVSLYPDLEAQLLAPGELPASRVAGYLQNCDILLQPFPDGITTRRTSAMAGFANAIPVVTNLGALSEPFWRNIQCVQLAPNPDPVGLVAAVEAVLALSPAARHEMAQSAAALYRDNFSLEQTITRLRTSHSTR